MKILIFGATGMAGGAVLEACLAAPMVDEVRAIARRPLAHTDAKLRTFVHEDFENYATVEQAFWNIDACLFCLGVSVTQVSKEEYRRISCTFPLAAAKMLKKQCGDAAFHYISGQGTNAKSRMFWAQVKAQTEAKLMALVGACCWRPAFIDAKPSTSVPGIYRLLFPLGRVLKPFANLYVAGQDLGKAMLQATVEKMRERVIENREIREIAARTRW